MTRLVDKPIDSIRAEYIAASKQAEAARRRSQKADHEAIVAKNEANDTRHMAESLGQTLLRAIQEESGMHDE